MNERNAHPPAIRIQSAQSRPSVVRLGFSIADAGHQTRDQAGALVSSTARTGQSICVARPDLGLSEPNQVVR